MVSLIKDVINKPQEETQLGSKCIFKKIAEGGPGKIIGINEKTIKIKYWGNLTKNSKNSFSKNTT